VRASAELNGAGGIDCHYTSPVFVRSKRALFIELDIAAKKPGAYWLSFRGSDRRDKETFAKRVRFTVEQDTDREGPANQEV